MLYVQVITRRARPTREFLCRWASFGPSGVFSSKLPMWAATNNLHFFVKVFLAVFPDLRYTVVVFWSMGSEMADVSVERI